MLVEHGTPQDFDKFDESQIGNGVGNSWGWGVYFTDSQVTADYYAHQKNSKTPHYFVAEIPDKEYLLNWSTQLQQQSDYVEKIIIEVITDIGQDFKKRGNSLFDYIKNLFSTKTTGEKQQSYLKNLQDIKSLKEITHTIKGADFYKLLVKIKGGQKEASLYLKSKGIPGVSVKNLAGTPLYVVWDMSKIEVKNKNKIVNYDKEIKYSPSYILKNGDNFSSEEWIQLSEKFPQSFINMVINKYRKSFPDVVFDNLDKNRLRTASYKNLIKKLAMERSNVN